MTDWADDIAATLRNQEHAAQALRDERERCAKVTHHFTGSLWTPMENGIAKLIEEAIRNQKP